MNNNSNEPGEAVPKSESLGPEAGQPAPWTVPSALDELWVAGQSDVVLELVQLFLSDTADRLGRLREALGHSDFGEVRRMAHSIKGSCSQMGEDLMARLGKQLEDTAKAESHEESRNVLERLQRQFEASSRAMRVFLEKHA